MDKTKIDFKTCGDCKHFIEVKEGLGWCLKDRSRAVDRTEPRCFQFEEADNEKD